jgi:signal transduction histidine kinase
MGVEKSFPARSPAKIRFRFEKIIRYACRSRLPLRIRLLKSSTANTLRAGRYRGPEQLAEYLELLARENARLNRTVENFLTLSRIERGVYAFQREAVSPNQLAAMAVEMLQLKVDAIPVECRFMENLPPVLADREAMLIALENLLDNARKYTGEEKRIAVETRLEGNRVVFIVEDNGPGIAPAERRKIFERYYQVDQKLTRRVEGCGLGLSIVKQIIDAHGGEIAVEGAPGRGSRFLLLLPLA